MSEQDQDSLAQAFVQFAVDCGVLRFGEYKTKAGRMSPYFFNAGLFDDGAKLDRLAQFYAQRLLTSGIEFDMIFGPAYKGIPLGAVLAAELARRGRNVPFAYNRKETKDHGEGGTLVGAPLKGRVLIVDDVMSAGTAVRESIALIESAGARPHAVVIALDRQEKPPKRAWMSTTVRCSTCASSSALQVAAIARLDDLMQFLQHQNTPDLIDARQRVLTYRARYGVAD
jgi:orotate phosphoribosyltransferase